MKDRVTLFLLYATTGALLLLAIIVSLRAPDTATIAFPQYPQIPGYRASSVAKTPLSILLTFMPAAWLTPDQLTVDDTSISFIGPRIEFIDLTRARHGAVVQTELLPGTARAVSSIAPFTQGLSFHYAGLALAPRDGWGIENVDQQIYCSSPDVAVMSGRFDPAAIRDRLLELGYRPAVVHGLDTFTNPTQPLQFAMRGSEILIIARERSTIQAVAQQQTHPKTSAANQATLIEMQRYLRNAWAAVIAVRADAQVAQRLQALCMTPRQFVDLPVSFADAYCTHEPRIAWQTMAVGFWGARSTSGLRFLFAYPTAQEANTDLELAHRTLTEVQRSAVPLQMQNIHVRGSLLVATGTTTARDVLGQAALGLPEYLPIRQVPLAATPTLSTTLPSSWILYEKPLEGFAVALPRSWQVVPLSPQALGERMTRGENHLPSAMPPLSKTGAALAARLFAVDTTPLSAMHGHPATLVAGRFLIGESASPSAVADDAAAALEQTHLLQGPITRETVYLGDRSAEKLQYHVAGRGTDGGKITLRRTLYLVVDANWAYSMCLTVELGLAPAYRLTTQGIEESFRLLAAVA